jgi:hypothetical protein
VEAVLSVSRMIHLGTRLDLGAHAFATNVVAALGMRGSGKSNTMTVAVEGLLEAEVQVIVLDYVGIWFGLRLTPAGRPSPYPIPVLGGRHGDITLVAGAGRQVAEALAASHSSAVLDISAFTKGDRIKFAADFGEAFFHAKKTHEGPVFLVLEEAQRFVPQVMRFSDPALSRCLGAFEEIAEVGRNYGIGLGLISQRPQKINKDVLNLAELVFAFQTNGVLERKAIAEWVQEKGAEGRAEVTGELPGLPRGTAIVWSPSTFKLYGKYALAKKTTYDAGATPDRVRAAVTVKPLDLKSLQGAMEAVVKEAKVNDPRALRARIAELEKTVQFAAKAEAHRLPPPAKVVTKPVLKEADLKRLERLVLKLADRGDANDLRHKIDVEMNTGLQALIGQLMQHLVDATAERPSSNTITTTTPGKLYVPRTERFVDPGRGPRQAHVVENGDGYLALSKCARALLTVLASRGVATDSQISALSGYRKTSSGFTNALSELRTRGFIDGPKERRVVTDTGRIHVGPVEPPPQGPALLSYWLPKLGKCEAALLKTVYEYGTVTREYLSRMTGYSTTSSGFTNGISGLRTLDLVTGPSGGDLTIADVFKE